MYRRAKSRCHQQATTPAGIQFPQERRPEGHKLKKIWKARTSFGLSKGSKSKTSTEPPSSILFPEPSDTSATLDEYPNEFGLRSPPGLLDIVCFVYLQTLLTTEGYSQMNYYNGGTSIPQSRESTPKLTEGRKKLFKPQTTAEIKHIRRRTLPACPLGDPAQHSPMITISSHRPRPRSLIFTTSPDRYPTVLSASPSQSPQADLSALQYLPVPVTQGTNPRNRKRWSGLSFFTRQ